MGLKRAEKGKKAEKLRFSRLTHAFLGKKLGKGDQGNLTLWVASRPRTPETPNHLTPKVTQK